MFSFLHVRWPWQWKPSAKILLLSAHAIGNEVPCVYSTVQLHAPLLTCIFYANCLQRKSLEYVVVNIFTLCLYKSFWTKHIFRPNPFIKLFLRQVSQTDCLLLEGSAILMRSLGNLCCFIVPNVRIQGCHQHQWLIQEFIDSFSVDCDSINTLVCEGDTTITKKPKKDND